MMLQAPRLLGLFGERVTKLIKFFEKVKKSLGSSLRFTLLTALVVSLFFAAISYVVVRFGSGVYISQYYTSEENRAIRENQYAKALQDYITRNELSSEDVKEISRWASSNRYVYIMVHKDDRLLFESGEIDKPNENPTPDNGEGGEIEAGKEEEGNLPSIFPDSGITVELPTREDLIKYAEEKDAHLITMSDANVLVSMADFTEYFYYDIFNISAIVVAAAVLVIILMIYFQRVTNRITALATEVTMASDGENGRGIRADGEDEIGRLAKDVENMRCALLRTVAKEKEAVEANNELITSMSHDIRTPLTVLLGYIDVMKGQENTPQMKGYIEATEKTALRLKKLSDDLFNYFLVFGGDSSEVEMAEYELILLLDQMLSEHFLLLGEQGYEIDSFSAEQITESLGQYSVLTDAQLLKRIFENLFSNILKYADKSAPVSISCSVCECKLLLTMSNKVDKNKGEVESNHIGLRTCKKISEKIGVAFDTERDGDCFTVRMEFELKRRLAC